MALRLNPSDGNSNVILGGIWNAPVPTAVSWACPTRGLTAFGLALTFEPPSTGLAGGASGFYPLFHQRGGTSWLDVWQLWHTAAGVLVLELFDRGNARAIRAETLGPVIRPGRRHRIIGGWEARRNRVVLWINKRPYELSITRTGALDHLTDNGSPAGYAPITIGAVDQLDIPPSAGIYSEPALWGACPSVRDARRYGMGWSPDLLSVPNRLKYTHLDYPTKSDPANSYAVGFPTVFHLFDEWTGEQYGDTLVSYNYGGGPFNAPAQGAFNAEVVVHPRVVSSWPRDIQPDHEMLPRRRVPLPELRGRIGKRSGIVRTVTGAGDIQTVLNQARPGDNVHLPSTLTPGWSLTLPDARAWVIDDATPRCAPPPQSPEFRYQRRRAQTRRVAQTRRPQGEPSYIQVSPADLSGLPAIDAYRVDLPDGTFLRPLHEASRVSPLHAPAMAELQFAQGYGLIDQGFGLAQGVPAMGWCFRGIRLNGPRSGSNDLNFLMWFSGGNGYNNPTVWRFGRKFAARISKRIMFNQCLIDADPADIGISVGTALSGGGHWQVLVNSFLDKFHSIGGGDAKLIAVETGPQHWENTVMRSPSAIYFTGGGGSPLTWHVPSDITDRRVWLVVPRTWHQGEVNPQRNPGWRVKIINGANGWEVQPFTWAANYGVGGSWTDPSNPAPTAMYYRPNRGDIMYEHATGIARRVSMAGEGDDVSASPVRLESAWPNGPVADTWVTFQRTAAGADARANGNTDWEDKLALYNGGLETPMNYATTVAGSRHVTLSKPLPQELIDEVNAGARLHFYTNDTYWLGDFGGEVPPVWSPPPTDPKQNGWGFRMGLTRAQSRRKIIASIAPDGLSLELDPNQAPTGYFESITFPFSITRFDGLWRPIFYHYKGSWENKIGERWVHEGTVLEHANNRCYVHSQTWHTACGQLTIQGNIATFLSGPWSTYINPYYLLRSVYGAPWPFTCLSFSDQYPQSEYGQPGRIVDRPIDSTHLLLLPPVAGLQTIADRVNGPGWFWSGTLPWSRIYRMVQRYNIFGRGASVTWFAETSYTGAVRLYPGGQSSYHDNLRVRGAAQLWDAPVKGQPSSIPGGSVRAPAGPTGDPIFDYWDQGQNGRWRVDHCSTMRTSEPLAMKSSLLSGLSPTTPRSQYVSVKDNLLADIDNPLAVLSGYHASNTEVSDPGVSLDLATSRLRGNVFQGAGLFGAFHRWSVKYGNGIVRDVTALGLPNYANGDRDGYNLATYQLADVYTAGTVSISSDGLEVVHAGGAWPSPPVEPGQFFRTTTALRPVRVNAIGTRLSTWRTYANYAGFCRRAGVAFAQGQDTRDALMTYGGMSTPDQWLQLTIAALPPQVPYYFGFLLRCADDSPTGYFLEIDREPIAWNPDPTVVWTIIWQLVNGQPTAVLTSGGGTCAVGDVFLCEVHGSTITWSRNGVPFRSYAGATQYATGRVGLTVFQNNPLIQFSNFQCGDYGGGGGARRRLDTEVWTGAEDTLVLETAYPERNVTGKAFSLGFRQTATDYTDPGVDLETSALMLRGVRDPAWADH